MMGRVRDLALPGARQPLARVALICAGYVVAFAVVYVFTVQTVPGRRLADASLRGAISVRPLLSGTVQTILDVVSVASLLGAVAVVAVIALIRLARLEGLMAIGILVGSNLSTWLLKNVLLPRPDLGLREIAPATLNSLPSGHTTAVFSAVAALIFVSPRRWREVTATVGVVYATLTGLATMLAGWHRAGDSVAAFLVVGAWTGVAAAVVLVSAPGRAGPAVDAAAGAATVGATDGAGVAARSLPVRWLVLSALGCLTLGVALGVGLVLASLAPGNLVGSVTAFLAGALFIAGTASGVTVGILKMLDLVDAAVASRPADRS